MNKSVMNETPFDEMTIGNNFNGFPSNYPDDEENMWYDDNDPNIFDGVVGDTGESIIDAIDSDVIDPEKIDSKIQELVSSDGVFNFMGYEDYLEKFSREMRIEVDNYVHDKYPELFENDEVGGVEPMKNSDISEDEIPYHVVKNRNRKKDLYSTLNDDYNTAA